MNALEQDLVKRLTAIPNVLWWHRNIARHGFAINGYFNHYPDIMIMTQSGKIDLILTKSISRFGRNIVDILDIPPMCCACWMARQRCSQSVCARAVSRRALSSPSRGANRRVL